jgi:hypothetical protein
MNSTTIALSGSGMAPILATFGERDRPEFRHRHADHQQHSRRNPYQHGQRERICFPALRVTGRGFSVSGLALPVTLSAKQAVSFDVVFVPTLADSATGGV